MIRHFFSLALVIASFASNAMTAKSYIVTEMDGRVIVEKNADDVRSIASITKLFTARGSAAYDMSEMIEILPEDMKTGRMRSTPLKIGQSYSRGLLMELALVSSDNVAALALGRSIQPISTLPPSTTIVEASGLDPQNQSSARDLASVARELVDTELAKTSVQPTVMIDTKERHSTNPLLTRNGWNFKLSKTGFINQAGGCLVVVFETGGRLVTAVILGSSGVPARWKDLYELRQQLNDHDTFAGPPSKVKLKAKRKGRR